MHEHSAARMLYSINVSLADLILLNDHETPSTVHLNANTCLDVDAHGHY